MKVELEELIAMLTPHGPALDSVGASTSPGKLKPADLAAACTGIEERGPYLLFLHTFLHDDSVYHELLVRLTRAFVTSRELPDSHREPLEPLARLVALALEETRHPAQCQVCNGTGLDSRLVDSVHRDCPACLGQGSLDKTKAIYRARRYGCSTRWWRKQWRDVYQMLLNLIQVWQTQAHYQLKARFEG